MKRKVIGALSVIMIVAFMCIYFIPVNRDVNESFRCNVLDQQDETYADEITVVLTGTYSDYLLKKDTFEGRIDIPGYELMHEKASDLSLTIGDYEFNHILNYNPIDHTLNYQGSISLCEDLKTFFLWLNVSDETDPSISHGRYFLCYPEMTIDEVYAILNREN